VSLTFDIWKKHHAPEVEVAAAKVNTICLRVFRGSLRDFLPEL
jgi:hypothetical protein